MLTGKDVWEGDLGHIFQLLFENFEIARMRHGLFQNF